MHLVVFVFAGEALEAASNEQQLHEFARIQGGRIGRHHAQNGFYKAAHGLHGLAEFLVSFGVEPGMAGNLASRLPVIIHAPQVVTIGHGRECAVERKNFQSVAGKIEVADDFRAQQRDHVRAHRELESGKHFFRDCCSAEHVPALQHQHLPAGAGQIGGVGEAIVASADHDYVVFRFCAVAGNHCLFA